MAQALEEEPAKEPEPEAEQEPQAEQELEPEPEPEPEPRLERAQEQGPGLQPSVDCRAELPSELKRGRARSETLLAPGAPAQEPRGAQMLSRHAAEGPIKKFKGMSGVADFTAMFSSRGLRPGSILPSQAVTYTGKVVKDAPDKSGAESRRSWFG